MKVIILEDPVKNRENIKKHGISFDLARNVFIDPFRVELIVDGQYPSLENNSFRMDSQEISAPEMPKYNRYITIGYINNVAIYVSYALEDDTLDDKVNEAEKHNLIILSARKALKSEVDKYYYGKG